jgi:hypothetical protein
VQFAAALSHYLKMGMGIFPTATNPDRKIREGNQSSIWPGCGEFAPATEGNANRRRRRKTLLPKTQERYALVVCTKFGASSEREFPIL